MILPPELRSGVIPDALAWTIECIGKRGNQIEPRSALQLDLRTMGALSSGLRAAAYRTPYEHIGDYMERFWVFPEIFGQLVRLHHTLRSDDGRDMHDHPWHFASVILEGGYTEELEVFSGTERPLREVTRYRPGDVLFRHAEHRHRLQLENGHDCWSLVFTSPKVRDWGFWTAEGFVPWERYGQQQPAAA